jgi:hypothetical protein
VLPPYIPSSVSPARCWVGALPPESCRFASPQTIVDLHNQRAIGPSVRKLADMQINRRYLHTHYLVNIRSRAVLRCMVPQCCGNALLVFLSVCAHLGRILMARSKGFKGVIASRFKVIEGLFA